MIHHPSRLQPETSDLQLQETHRTNYLWSKDDWNKIQNLASVFSESFLPEHGTRLVEKNYTMFKEFIAFYGNNIIQVIMDNV